MRFIVEIQDSRDDDEIEPGEIRAKVFLEDGTCIGMNEGPERNPNVLGYVDLQMLRHQRAERSGVPVRMSGIMSEADIEEEMSRIIPI